MDINEVRRLLAGAVFALPGSRVAADVGALLADHARLQEVNAIMLKSLEEMVKWSCMRDGGDHDLPMPFDSQYEEVKVAMLAIEAAKAARQ